MDPLEASLLEQPAELDADSAEPAFQPPPSVNEMRLRSKKGEAMRTGPKGVLADWRASSKAHSSEQPVLSSGEESESESERDAVERYRQQRMAELKSAGPYGHLREIGVEQFEGAVVQADEGVKVVLHLYEPQLPGNALLSRHLAALARTQSHVKFLRARASELDYKVDKDVLPVLLIYQGGELVDSLIAIDREWGQRPDVTLDEVKAVLERHGLVNDTQATPKASRFTKLHDDSDD